MHWTCLRNLVSCRLIAAAHILLQGVSGGERAGGLQRGHESGACAQRGS